MQYTSTIDNISAQRWGLNLSQAYLFDYLFKLPGWADPIKLQGDYFHFCSRHKVVEDLPLLGFKADTIHRNFKQLENLDIIEYMKQGRKDLIRITQKGREWGKVYEEEEGGSEPESTSGFQGELPLEHESKSELNTNTDPTNYNTNNTRDSSSKKKPYPKWSIEDLQDDIKLNMHKVPELDGVDLDEFEDHWTGITPKGNMLFTEQKSWSTAGRLRTWARNKEKFSQQRSQK